MSYLGEKCRPSYKPNWFNGLSVELLRNRYDPVFFFFCEKHVIYYLYLCMYLSRALPLWDLFWASHYVADSTNSFVDDTDQEFRSKVEKIRQIGGDSWLKIFDEMQGEAEMTQVCV